MSLLLETLRCFNGHFDALHLHQQRMARSRFQIWGYTDILDIRMALEKTQPSKLLGCWKVRVFYNKTILRVEWQIYHPKIIKTVASIEDNTIEYTHKWAEHSHLDALAQKAQTLGMDGALIVKNGLVSDFTYGNAAFYDGRTWWTPAIPLLAGTRRERLLQSGKLQTRDIPIGIISEFRALSLINAMLDLGEITIDTTNIFPLNELNIEA